MADVSLIHQVGTGCTEYALITTHVCSTTGGYVFTGVCLSGGEGVPQGK